MPDLCRHEYVGISSFSASAVYPTILVFCLVSVPRQRVRKGRLPTAESSRCSHDESLSGRACGSSFETYVICPPIPPHPRRQDLVLTPDHGTPAEPSRLPPDQTKQPSSLCYTNPNAHLRHARHTATRSSRRLDFASDFACPRPASSFPSRGTISRATVHKSPGNIRSRTTPTVVGNPSRAPLSPQELQK